MAGEPKDPHSHPGYPVLPGFPLTPLPFVPPDLWFQMWLPILLGPYREFLLWYRMAIAEWNKEKVDEPFRLLGNEFVRTSLAMLAASREVRSKLTQFQLESIDNYLKFLDGLAGAGEPPKS
jgi:hypothetical protein